MWNTCGPGAFLLAILNFQTKGASALAKVDCGSILVVVCIPIGVWVISWTANQRCNLLMLHVDGWEKHDTKPSTNIGLISDQAQPVVGTLPVDGLWLRKHGCGEGYLTTNKSLP